MVAFLLPGVVHPCTCVVAPGPPSAESLIADSTVVFRGVVTERKTLPLRPDMHGRNRYSITFRVDEYWKGSPGRTVVIYGMDPTPDCLGDGGYRSGKEYLVFAYQQRSTDVLIGPDLWYGWKDILPEGSPMLTPTVCRFGGETANIGESLRLLGRGKVPQAETTQ